MTPAHDEVIAATRHWLEAAVIGLNLCPFAKAVHLKGQIEWIVSAATSEAELAAELSQAAQRLAAAPADSIDTTLLIHPRVLVGFDDYNQFLDVAESILVNLRLDGVLQIASFHPHYRFAGSRDNDVANCSNRSPYPMLHLLREASVERAVAAFPDAARIYDRSMATLRALGGPGWRRLMKVKR
jgi:uncharacterized protein